MKFWQIPGVSAKISFRHSSVCQPENEGCLYFYDFYIIELYKKARCIFR
ncbi:MAG: hypothetical protein GY795_29685 [Desulfobacterales bacterium]|nr:hypothetical protein [Desulfobacterales bacterium]